MKFVHTSDLHIGKRLFELSMLEEQKAVLEQIYSIAVEEAVQAVVIAGDVYDRAVPPAEAVILLDDFLTRLAEARIPVIMISGNHDCGERVAFADRILEKQGLYIAGTYDGRVKDVTIPDEWGMVHFICLPFVKPSVVGADNSEEAVEKMLSDVPMLSNTPTYVNDSMHLNAPMQHNVWHIGGALHRYVLVTHYFVTGEQGEKPEVSDSETTVNIGGLDNVSASLFENFSYVALGHIHKPQKIGQGNVYYSGSPVKYSFSEAMQEKGVNLVELDEKGEVTVKRRLLRPVHDMRCIKGQLAELMKVYTESEREDYLQVTLTDKEELIDPMGTLRSVYPNVLQIIMEKNICSDTQEYESRLSGERKSTVQLFADFYEMLKGETLDEIRRAYVEDAVKEAESSCDR